MVAIQPGFLVQRQRSLMMLTRSLRQGTVPD